MIPEVYLHAFLMLMLRMILGGLFFFQAWHKLFKIGLQETFDTVAPAYRGSGVPRWFVKISIPISTFIELFTGGLVLAGLFLPVAYILLGINLIMVSIGFSFLKGIWDMQHVFRRLAILTLLFLLPAEWDLWALDSLFG